MAEYAVTLEQLSVGYHGKPLIEKIEFAVKPGEIYVLIGPNGAGKSTILKTITKQLKPLGGTIYVKNRNMTTMSENEVAKSMSMVTTQRLSTELMTCRDMVATGRYPYTGRFGILGAKDKEIVSRIMEKFQIAHLADKDFMELSDGQKQRVMLARAFCQEPQILVLDEPTSFLDIRYKVELLSIIREFAREEQIAVIMSLHELEFARRIADYVLCVKGDCIANKGTVAEIFQGNLIAELYGIEGCYDGVTGQVELAAKKGEPVCFVIGGAGSGLPIYHALQRQGIPFAAGVLHENDVEYGTAKALASGLFVEKAFVPVSEENLKKACEEIRKCQYVIGAVKQFGVCNEANRKLYELARELGKLKEESMKN